MGNRYPRGPRRNAWCDEPRSAEVTTGGDAGLSPKGGDVGARRPVADEWRDGAHRHLLGEVRQRRLQAHERTPAPEREARVALEGASERSAARADGTAP